MWPDNRYPAWVTISVLVFIVVIAMARWSLIRATTGERHINNIVLFATATALLREPTIAVRLAPVVPGGAPTLYTLWHALFLITAALFVGLFLLWDRGLAHYRTPQRRTLLLASLIGASLFVLAEPARRAGVSVPDAGGWRYAVFCTLTAGLLVGYCICNSRPVLTLRTRTQKERLVVLFLYALACGATVVSALTAIGAGMQVAGMTNALTDFAHLNISCELMLPLLFLGFATLIPSVSRSVARLARLDPDSRTLRRLYPVWADLTSAAPGVVLSLNQVDRRGATIAEQLHRRRVEIMDAAALVGHYSMPLPDSVDETIEKVVSDEETQDQMRQVVELAAASWRLKAIGGIHRAGVPPLDCYSAPDLTTLARLWKSARALVDDAQPHGVIGPRASQ